MNGKKEMWDVFPDDMGLDNNVELELDIKEEDAEERSGGTDVDFDVDDFELQETL